MKEILPEISSAEISSAEISSAEISSAEISKQSLILAVEEIRTRIEKGNCPGNKELIKICGEKNISIFENTSEPHLIHEILETAVNRYVMNAYDFGSMSGRKSFKVFEELESLTKNLPTQSWRGRDQIRRQQFSTPPALGFVMTQILKPQKGMIALEPSAGTGCLALWLKIAGCRTYVNEISARRRQFLEILDFAPHQVDAEFLDELLPEEIKPDLILMNPPFSASGGRRVEKRDSNFGFRHVRSALARLRRNGRLVALLGSDALLGSGRGRKFLDEIRRDYALKAVVKLPHSAFNKYGTSFQTAIICIEKTEPKTGLRSSEEKKDFLKVDCRSLEECLSLTDIFG